MKTRPQPVTQPGKFSVELLDGSGRWYIPAFADNLPSLADAEKKLVKVLRASALDATRGRIVEGGDEGGGVVSSVVAR